MNAPTKIFLACPIGAEGSDDRKRSDQLLKYVIAPVVQSQMTGNPDEIIVRADRISVAGRISKQIIEEIVSCQVMIADLTGDNPNVMYEVGLRQALLKPYILMAQKGHKLPFDLADIRTIFYQLELDTVDKVQHELGEYLKRALNGEVSAIDRDLLSTSPSNLSQTASSSEIQVLEASSKILQEVTGVRDLLLSMGSVVADLRERETREAQQKKEMWNQQLGLTVLQHMLKNPENIEKTLPALQKLIEFGLKTQNGNPEPNQGKLRD